MRKKYNLKAGHLRVMLVFLSIFLSQCKKDNLMISEATSPVLGAIPSDKKLATTGIISTSYYIVNALPSGYVKDGSRDYTSYVQAAVTRYSNIVFPNFPLLINDIGIKVGSDKTITFPAGSEIRLKPTTLGNYGIIKIVNASNVTLYSPVVVGDRFTHLGTSGEWGMGIGIYGSTNVKIYNAKVTDCWGDGIYLGQADGRINNKDIIIKDAYLRKNRRDGISIIGVDGLLLDNLYSGYSDGTLPMCGINIEPNNIYSEIKNVRINNPKTENNGKNGIQIGLRRMLGSTNKYSDITVVNHLDIGSPRYPFKVACSPGDEITGTMYGLIDIVNPSWHKTAIETNLYLWLSSNEPNLKTAVSSPEIMTLSGSILSWSDTYDAVMKASRGGVLSVTQEIKSLTSSSLEEEEPTSLTSSDVVFAVNAGGSLFEAPNGITYNADKNFVGGLTAKTTNGIEGTYDDPLYQSERYGNFSYNVPVSSGTYEITFKMAEIYFQTSGKRQFDILAENNLIVSNLDIYAMAGGHNKVYDIVKTVTVTDGTLNLNFKTDINNAKVSALHVRRL